MTSVSFGRGARLVVALLGSTAMSLCWTQALAGETLPAVSGFNAKLDAGGGGLDGSGVYFVDAAITMPLGDQFGLQVDGIAGAFETDGFGGAAAHLFWRDPSIALIGIYGSGFANTSRVNYQLGNAGVEGALYVGQFTIEGAIGAQFVETETESSSDLYGAATLAFYPIDDLRIYGGYRHWSSESSIAAGAEWLLPAAVDESVEVSFFGDARIRDDENMFLTGVRIYFGPHKSLMRRHREDDPGPLLPEDLFTIERTLPTPPSDEEPLPDGIYCPPEPETAVYCPPIDGINPQ